MHDLQLVGFTTDRRGLIFRSRAGARPEASFVVPITDELVELVTRLGRDERAGSEPDGSEEVDTVDAGEDVAPVEDIAPRPRSQMSVRDIQARLRAGEAVARIAAEAGVDEDWIERFAPPVRAEQQRIVARALDSHLERSRSAPSAVPLRRAVGMALADKGIAYTVAAFQAAWSARLLGHDRWAVEFTYRHRGRERTATWSYDASEGSLTTADRSAAQLGYVAPGRAVDEDGDAVDGIVGDPAATRTVTDATEAPAAERSTVKKKPAAKKSAVRKKPAAKKSAVRKKAAAKKSAVRKKAAAEKSATKKKAAEKAPTTRAPAKRSSAKTPGPAPRQATVRTKSPAEKAKAKAPAPTPPPAPEDRAPRPTAPPPAPHEVADRSAPRRLPDEPPRPASTPPAPTPDHAEPEHRVAGRPGEIPISEAPLADQAPEARTNGRPTPPRRPGDEADPASARRARAAQRNAPTVQFRSGSAAPVRAAGDADPPGEASPHDRADGPVQPPATNGAARPASRRRRQLRAR